MSWVAVAVGVVTAAGSAVAASQQQKKAAKAQASAANGINLGQKPRAAEYYPIDFSEEQLNTIMGNLGALPKADELMRGTNDAIDRDAMLRAKRFIPGYKENMRLQGSITTDLLNGRLPYDDVLGIVADRADLSNALGTPGTAAPATMRDLGLSRLDAIKSGSGMMAQMVQLAETVNPVGRRYRPQDMFLNPADRIAQAMNQQQLIQQSNQNKFNLDAGISPTQQAQAQLQLQGNLSAANSGIDWASLIRTVGGGVSQGLAGGGATGATGSYDMAADPQLYRGAYGNYYTAPAGQPSTRVPRLSDQYSIPA